MPTPARRRTVFLHHSGYRPFGGAEQVTAWILQALGEDHHLWLHAAQPRLDWRVVDERFSTRLAGRPPRILRRARSVCWIERILPFGGRMLSPVREQVLMRRLHARLRPDLWIGGYNEGWLPARGMICLHHPERLRLPEPSPHWHPIRRAAFRALLQRQRRLLAPSVPPDDHHIVANSRWTAATYRAIGGRSDAVVPPPVAALRRGPALGSAREPRARARPVQQTQAPRRGDRHGGLRTRRRRRPAPHLRGFWHAPAAHRRELLERTAALDWVDWVVQPSRRQLETLAGRCRYGLHAMVGEHFGIAVAELASAGCVVVAPADGGPAEILDEPRQLFRDYAEGASVLHRTATDRALQAELHASARARGLLHSPERFSEAIRAEVSRLL